MSDANNPLMCRRGKDVEGLWNAVGRGARELGRSWGSGLLSDVAAGGVTSSYGPAVTSRSSVFDPHNNETSDVVTSKTAYMEKHVRLSAT